jgi:hypothetical protein
VPTGYEVQAYNDLKEIARSNRAISSSLERLAQTTASAAHLFEIFADEELRLRGEIVRHLAQAEWLLQNMPGGMAGEARDHVGAVLNMLCQPEGRGLSSDQTAPKGSPTPAGTGGGESSRPSATDQEGRP